MVSQDVLVQNNQVPRVTNKVTEIPIMCNWCRPCMSFACCLLLLPMYLFILPLSLACMLLRFVRFQECGLGNQSLGLGWPLSEVGTGLEQQICSSPHRLISLACLPGTDTENKQQHNARKVLSYIVIDKICTTQTGLHYLSKYPDQFFNVSILHVASPLVMYKFFGSVNEVDYHNKSRQSDLSLEKFQATQCGWIGLCMTFSMVNNITN